MNDFKLFMNDLDDRPQAVCGATSRSHEVVCFCVVEIMVHAINKVERRCLPDRRRHDYLRHASIEEWLNLWWRVEHAETVDDDIDLHILQGKPGML